MPDAAAPADRRAFTLTELMLAVAVLIVVVLGTSKIFGTASRITSLGEAVSDVVHEAGTIERQLREDVRRISDDAFLLIRCVAVRNDVNLAAGGPLLDPARPPSAFLRADQLFFFVDGAQQMMTLGTIGTNIRGLGVTSRVYYGHGIQLPFKPAAGDPGVFMNTWDFAVDMSDPLVPWHRGPYDAVRTTYRRDPGNPPDYTITPAGMQEATQPPAPRWLLMRHAVVMADDGDARPEHYLLGNRTAFTIDHDPVFHGRVDGVSQQMHEVRRLVTLAPMPFNCGGVVVNVRPWNDPGYPEGDQRDVIAALCGRTSNLPVYTRGERVAPGMQRVDQALTNNVIATACSSFMVDWTYAPRTGERRDPDGNVVIAPGLNLTYGDSDDVALTGVLVNASDVAAAYREQPWFGLEEPDRGVHYYGTDRWPWWQWANTIDPDHVERVVHQDAYVRVYEATFGFNRGLAINADDNPDPFTTEPACGRVGYTPWPTALRITMVLHDQQQRLIAGRTFQFVVDLPSREP